MYIKKMFIPIALAVGVLSGCSSQTKPGDTIIAPQVIESNTVTATAKIIKLDKEQRTLTIEQGQRLTLLVVSPEVELFSTLEVGDLIEAEYTESVALHVQAHDGTARLQTSGDIDPSSSSGGISAEEKTQIIADILAIDKANNSVTLKGPQGGEMVLPVERPEYLNKVSVGDQVVVTYTQAVAISIKEKK